MSSDQNIPVKEGQVRRHALGSVRVIGKSLGPLGHFRGSWFVDPSWKMHSEVWRTGEIAALPVDENPRIDSGQEWAY